MRNPSKCLLALLLFCSMIVAAEPKKATKVTLDVTGDTVTVIRSFPVTVTAPAGASGYAWLYPSAIVASRDRNVLTIKSAPKGEHRIVFTSFTVDFDKKTVTENEGELTVTVGEVAPAPPGPGPTPAPPTPTPPSPAPMPATNLRVLFVTESSKTLPSGKLAAMKAKSVRDYLNAKCDTEGMTKAWRVFDKDQPFAASTKGGVWQDAIARGQKELPWVVISNGKKGFEGPVPASDAELLKLLQEYGGP